MRLPLCGVLAVLVFLTACKRSEPPAAKTAAATPASEKAAAKAQADKPSEPDALAAPPDVAQAPDEAMRTASGLASITLKPGSGTQHPEPDDQVEVHYSGWTSDGKLFDSSVRRGVPITLALNKVIKGWTEGVQLMVTGEKRRFWIPPELAYGRNPPAQFPSGTLVFDIELLGITPGPKPIPAPADVKKPPHNARRTPSHLAYRVLKRGTGKRHPKPTDQVEVHYTGWLTDGRMFDSSVQRGHSTTFLLGNVIPGWTEGLQHMVEGEKTRFWIPKELAYNDQPGRPRGMLVFDVELIAIR